MSTGRKAMLEVSKQKMTPALSAEHQRKWDESRWECKLGDPERNYDKSREALNFEIRKDRSVAPIDKSVSINERVEQRIEEWKAQRKESAGTEPIVRCTQHKSVNLILGGNRERMRELAFGNQQLQERGNNAHIIRKPEIEQWALDQYDFLGRQFGYENIVSFIVHCDELNPHAHAVVVPILPDGRLSAKEMFGGNSLQETKAHMRQLHTLYAEVNAKWGLERGDDIQETGARHKSLEEHNRELFHRNRTLEDEITIKQRTVKGLTTMIENLTKKQSDIQSEIDELEKQLQQSGVDKEEVTRTLERLRAQLENVREELSRKGHLLENAFDQLSELQDKIGWSKSNLKQVQEVNEQMCTSLMKNISIYLKASIFDEVIYIASRMCAESHVALEMAENTFIDDRHYLRFDDVMNTAFRTFIAGIDGSSGMSPSAGGGGTSNDMPWRDKDEDLLDWARRCMRYAHNKHYPRFTYNRTRGR